MTAPPIDTCQRWELGRTSYRPAREVVDTRRFDVVEIDELTAKAFVEQHHYSRRYPAARFRFGLYELGELVGVAVFSQPFQAKVITNAFPTLQQPTDGVELGRFVLLDRVGANGETWFLARCFEQLAGRVLGVVSFSDPWERATADERVIFPGHIGTIYQAANARYRGLTDDSSLRILPDATVFSNMASGKIRRHLTGWRSCVAELVRFGAAPLDDEAPEQERIDWLERWRGELTRPMRHRGNHRYTWMLDRRRRREVPYGPERAYPKKAKAA